MIGAFKRWCQVYLTTYRYLGKASRAERDHGFMPLEILRSLKRAWAREVLTICGLEIEVRGDVPKGSGMILVGNHVSYLDIPMLMASVDVSFVAKAELGRWPAIGPGARRAETVLVSRECMRSRRDASLKIADAVTTKNRNVAIFPSGTTTIEEKNEWKTGSLKIAHDHDLTVAPFRIFYDPIRPAAYIDRDTFPFHLFNVMRVRRRTGAPIKAVIEFGRPMKVTDPKMDANQLREWCNEPAFRATVRTSNQYQAWSRPSVRIEASI